MKSPPSIQSFSFISSSNFVHMVHHILRLTHAWPLPLCTAPAQSEPVCLPTSAAAGAWLAAIYRHFWKEAGIRVPRSPSVYTHTAAGSNWVNEGESGGARKCGFSALHPHIPAAFPTTVLLLSCSSVDLWTAFFSPICSKHPLHWSGDCLLAVDFAVDSSSIGAQSVPAVRLSVEQSEEDLSLSVIFYSILLPCLTLRWNARSELFHLRFVDVHSGKGRGGMNRVGGERKTSRGLHVARFVNDVKRLIRYDCALSLRILTSALDL